jgi:hypothetical protein
LTVKVINHAIRFSAVPFEHLLVLNFHFVLL